MPRQYNYTKKTGRPNKYTPERLKEIVQMLTEYIDNTEMPILAEFGYKNNIDSKHLYDYSEFTDLLKKAIQKKAVYLERKALGNDVNVTQAIFSLKQIGWSDKKKVDIDAKVENKTDLSKMSIDKLKKIESILEEDD